MYTYTFNIYDAFASDIIISIILKAENRFSRYKSIFIKTAASGQGEWFESVKDVYKKEDQLGEPFFEWLWSQHGLVPYGFITPYIFAPYELYNAVKRSNLYNITVETNEPVEDFGDPGTYFDDMYDPNVVY